MVVTMTTPEERVRVLIGRSGLSQGEFASRIGLDPTKLSKSLSGVRRFTSLELAQIAELSVTTVDWILTGEESVLATAARASQGGSAAMALDQATELVELRESAARLGYPQAWTPVARREGQAGVPRGPAYAQGAQLAGAALAHLDSLGLHPVTLDLAGLVEAAFGADVCLAPLGEGFDGLAVTTPQARVIVAACGGQPYRQRFTIAHELGHLLSADDQGVHADPDVLARTSEPTEIRANAFAAALLMPEAHLSTLVGPGFDRAAFCRLAIQLMVSPSALAYRLADLRLIDEMTRDQWRGVSAKAAARESGQTRALAEHAAYTGNPRRPGLLARDLYAAYVDGRATARLYARLVGVPAEAFAEPGESGG